MVPQITPFDFGEDVLNAGDTVSMTCTVGKGDLPLKIHWTLNDKELHSENNVLINRSGKRISLLSIENVQHEHIGNYTCIAENEAGRSSHSAVLKVNGILIAKIVFYITSHVSYFFYRTIRLLIPYVINLVNYTSPQ